jgi:hypothetical protein
MHYHTPEARLGFVGGGGAWGIGRALRHPKAPQPPMQLAAQCTLYTQTDAQAGPAGLLPASAHHTQPTQVTKVGAIVASMQPQALIPQSGVGAWGSPDCWPLAQVVVLHFSSTPSTPSPAPAASAEPLQRLQPTTHTLWRRYHDGSLTVHCTFVVLYRTISPIVAHSIACQQRH